MDVWNEVSKETKTLYIVIFLTNLYIFSNIYKLSISVIFSIFLSMYIIYQIFSYSKEKKDSVNNDLLTKLDYLNLVLSQSNYKQETDIGLRLDTKIPGTESSINIKSFLYLEPNLINLLYSIRDFEIYSKINYSKVIKQTNYILKIWNDMNFKDKNGNIALVNCAKNYKNALIFMKNANNYFHSFIYSLPVDTYYKTKYNNSLKRFRILMKRISDNMNKKCQKQLKEQGITTSTIFIPLYDTPKPAPIESSFIKNNFFI